MDPTASGWILFIAAFGSMLGLIAVDVSNLTRWTQATTPIFIGSTLGHIAVIITAFVGGRLQPTYRDPSLRSRAEDRSSSSTVPVPVPERK